MENAPFRAKSLKSLLKPQTGYGIWVLLHPLSNPSFLTQAGIQSVDSLVTGQIGEIPEGGGLTGEEAQAVWRAKVTSLLTYQYPEVSQTKATAIVWGRLEVVAVVGVTSDPPFSEVQGVADDVAETLYRVHQTELLRQEVVALRYVITKWSHPFLIVRDDASIVTGTEGGWDALYSYLRRRPVGKNPVFKLPGSLADKLGRSGSINLGAYEMLGGVMPDSKRETARPLHLVTLSAKRIPASVTHDSRLHTLTPSQRAVYLKMVAGLRNKEIAAAMGISVNTVVHHATAILSKMNCLDRLQLMAAAADQSESRKKTTAPPLEASSPVGLPKWCVFGNEPRSIPGKSDP